MNLLWKCIWDTLRNLPTIQQTKMFLPRSETKIEKIITQGKSEIEKIIVTRLWLHVFRLVSLNEDCHGPEWEVEVGFVDKGSPSNEAIIIPFHPKSIIPFNARLWNLDKKSETFTAFPCKRFLPILSSQNFSLGWCKVHSLSLRIPRKSFERTHSVKSSLILKNVRSLLW